MSRSHCCDQVPDRWELTEDQFQLMKWGWGWGGCLSCLGRQCRSGPHTCMGQETDWPGSRTGLSPSNSTPSDLFPSSKAHLPNVSQPLKTAPPAGDPVFTHRCLWETIFYSDCNRWISCLEHTLLLQMTGASFPDHNTLGFRVPGSVMLTYLVCTWHDF